MQTSQETFARYKIFHSHICIAKLKTKAIWLISAMHACVIPLNFLFPAVNPERCCAASFSTTHIYIYKCVRESHFRSELALLAVAMFRLVTWPLRELQPLDMAALNKRMEKER